MRPFIGAQACPPQGHGQIGGEIRCKSRLPAQSGRCARFRQRDRRIGQPSDLRRLACPDRLKDKSSVAIGLRIISADGKRTISKVLPALPAHIKVPPGARVEVAEEGSDKPVSLARWINDHAPQKGSDERTSGRDWVETEQVKDWAAAEQWLSSIPGSAEAPGASSGQLVFHQPAERRYRSARIWGRNPRGRFAARGRRAFRGYPGHQKQQTEGHR